MKVVSSTGTGSDVSSALNTALENVNSKLAKMSGLITQVESDLNYGVAGATVTVTLALNGSQPRKKEVIGVNVRGVSREKSIQKATRALNRGLEGKRGEIVDIFRKTVDTPFPGRVYTTLIVAINENRLQEVKDAADRRKRLADILELINGEPSALNVARIADIFGVSRTIIYRDLENLGFKRFGK